MKKIKKIYCDFDGTITKTDTVNTFFDLYADKKWIEYETLWKAGKITSRENAINQVALLNKVSEEALTEYINSVQLDDGFLEFLEFINKCGIELVILSDGFDLFIQRILEKHNISNINFYANHLIHQNNTFKIEFPHFNDKCSKGSGMCKCAKIQEEEFCYIGDGTSDLCVAQKAKILFAKDSLCKYCVTNNIKHIKFSSFNDIIKDIKIRNGVFNGSYN